MSKIFLIVSSCLLSSCVGNYGSGFDCKVPEGKFCRSLYEVNKLADQGQFNPESGIAEQCDCKENGRKK
jgi:hypothetical protein